MMYVVVPLLVMVLSFLSGMMGLGVAFVATPVLGLFGYDLKHVLMPWALWLNGLTAIASAIAFARAKLVDWRTALPLLAITTLTAPLGVLLLQFVPVHVVWWIYAGVLLFLAWRMAGVSSKQAAGSAMMTDKSRLAAGGLSGAISVFAGFLGVGPGFLMMPALVLLGYSARVAAATNSVIVTLPSFSAFISHLKDAQFDWLMLVLTSLTAMVGAQLGAAFTAKRVKSVTLSRLFAAALVILAVQRIYLLVR